jgi:hypothetical protein
MAQDSKKRQKALQRKAAKRKQKKSGFKGLLRLGGGSLLRQAGNWPLHEILLTEDWEAEGNIIQILVARKSTQGQLVIGVFLVDLGCLGVKNAFARPVDAYEYREIRQGFREHQAMKSTRDLNLVAKIIEESVAYARKFGFEPNRDYHKAKLVLGNADPNACPVKIPLGGRDGKPFFVAGPYDNVNRIMAKLTKAVGPDGFHYLMPIGPDTEILLDDEEYE